MNTLNASVIEAIDYIDEYELAYCTKLAKRFKNLGVDRKTSKKAIQHLVEQHAVPQCIAQPGFPRIGLHLFKQVR